MKKGDKAILINRRRLDEVNMAREEGKIVTLDEKLTRWEIETRPDKLHGEDTWWVRIDDPKYGVCRYYIPVSCLRMSNEEWLPGQRAVIAATDAELNSIGLKSYKNSEVTLVRPLNKDELTQYPQYNRGGWRIKIHHNAALAYYEYWIPTLYLQPIPQPGTSTSHSTFECGEPNQNNKTERKTEMNTYKVRFKQTPSVLAQQAGEKESIVATVPNILAYDEYCAVAEAAADNADAIKAVRDSKSSLSVTVKAD